MKRPKDWLTFCKTITSNIAFEFHKMANGVRTSTHFARQDCNIYLSPQYVPPRTPQGTLRNAHPVQPNEGGPPRTTPRELQDTPQEPPKIVQGSSMEHPRDFTKRPPCAAKRAGDKYTFCKIGLQHIRFAQSPKDPYPGATLTNLEDTFGYLVSTPTRPSQTTGANPCRSER